MIHWVSRKNLVLDQLLDVMLRHDFLGEDARVPFAHLDLIHSLLLRLLGLQS